MAVVLNRTLAGMAVAALAFIFIAGCRDSGPDIPSVLSANGYTVANISQKDVAYLGAVEANAADVNGKRVVAYKFSSYERRVQGEEALARIVLAGTGYWPINVATTTDSYFAKDVYLVFVGDHPDSERIKQLLDQEIP